MKTGLTEVIFDSTLLDPSESEVLLKEDKLAPIIQKQIKELAS